MRTPSACLSLALLVGVAASARPESLRVAGRVLTPGGAPLAGVKVELAEHLDPLDWARDRARGSSPAPRVRSITDDAGRYALDAPRAGVWTVRIDAPGFVPVEWALHPLVDSIELADIALDPDAGLHVRVVDSRGEPVAGVAVTARTPRGRFDAGTSGAGFPTRHTTTGSDGTARIPRGDRERLDLEAAAAGYALREVDGHRGTAATVRLDAGVRTWIEVVGGDDRPLPGTDVFIGSSLTHVGTVDDKGRLAVSLRRGVATTVAALAPDGRRARRLLDAPAEGAIAPARIVVPNRHVLVGRVIDAETRQAVPSAVVWDLREVSTAAATDRAGAFALGGAIGRLLEVSAAAPGYLSADPLEVHLLDDGRPGLTLPLAPGSAIDGDVVDTDGRAVVGAILTLAERRQTGGRMRIEIGRSGGGPQARTDEKGRFRLAAIDPSKSWDVRAKADGFAPMETAVAGLEPHRTKTGVRLTLSRGRAVSGTVVDRDGAPIRDAAVKLTRAAAPEGARLIRVIQAGGSTPAIEASTEDDGRFVIRGLADGKFDLEVRRRGYAPRKLPAIEVGTADSVDVGKLVLDPGETLQGYVRARGGAPIEGADVFVREGMAGPVFQMGGPSGAAPQAPDAVSDPTGFFAIADLAPERRYSIEVRRRGYVEGGTANVEVPRSAPIEVVLDPASDIAGRVVDSEDRGVASARLALQRARTLELGGNVARTIVMKDAIADGEGRFLFEDEEPGSISLTASAPGFQEAKLDHLAIPAGEDLTDLVLPLSVGAIVEGRVLGADGRAAIGASVRAVGDDPEDGPRLGPGNAAVDGDGYYRLDGLAPGKTSIEATHERYPRVVRDLELRAGRNPLDLTFEGGTEVTGQVRDSGGAAVGDARVTLVPAGRHWGGSEGRSSADGGFRVLGVTPGTYRIRAEASGYAPASVDTPVEVTDQPLAGLEISLGRGGSISGKIRGVDARQLADVSIEAQGGVGSVGHGSPDFRGDYRIERLPTGRYTVQGRIGSTGRQASGEATIEGEADARLDLEFGGGVALSGIALAGDVPVSGATLFVEGTDVEDSGLTRTDDAARFTLEGLDPGTYRVELREFVSGLAHTETIALASSREVTLRMPANRIAGRVVDAVDRQPLAAVSLTLGPATGATAGPPRTATTDVQGRFSLTSVPDGDWRLTASRKGYAAQTTPLAVTNGQNVDDVRVALDSTDGLGIEVRLPSGSAPTEALVAALDATGAALVSGTYATGENGSIRLSSVPPGEWTLLVSAPGAATATASVHVPGPQVRIALRPATALRVEIPALSGSNTVATARVRDASGQPFRSLGWSGSPRGEWPVASGRIDFASLPPDSWTVEITAADGRSWRGTATTNPGAPAALVLE